MSAARCSTVRDHHVDEPSNAATRCHRCRKSDDGREEGDVAAEAHGSMERRIKL